MYKDPDKQREANRRAMRRYREAEKRRKGITKVSLEQGITVSQEEIVIPKDTEFSLSIDIKTDDPEQPIIQQSHNPMMVGYVPPKD